MKIIHSLPLILLLPFTALTAHSTTIREALAEIERNNPQLKAILAENNAQESELRSENTLPSTSVEYSPFFRTGEKGVASSELIVSQEFDFPTMYGLRSRMASAERNVMDASAAVRRNEILTKAQKSLLDLILLQKERRIVKARLNDTQLLLEAYEKSLQLGSATILQVNKVKLESQDLERELLENKATIAEIENEIYGLNGNSYMALEELSYQIPTESLSVPDNIENLLNLYPSVKESEAEVEAARYGAKVADNGWLPGVTLGYRRNTEGKEASNGFLVGLSLPIFSNSSKTKAARARVISVTENLATAQKEAENLIESLRKQLQLRKSTLSTYDTALMEETLELYRKSLDAGQITLTEYFIETSSLYDRLMTRCRLENEIQQSYAELMSPTL